MPSLLLYAFVKWVAYSLWCHIGLGLLQPASDKISKLSASIGYGTLRWLLGLVLGVIAGISLGSIGQKDVGFLYLTVYTPLRLIEWGIIAALILRNSRALDTRPGKKWRVGLWIAGGIVVSYLSDLVSPEGLAGKFCVGRCLC